MCISTRLVSQKIKDMFESCKISTDIVRDHEMQE